MRRVAEHVAGLERVGRSNRWRSTCACGVVHGEFVSLYTPESTATFQRSREHEFEHAALAWLADRLAAGEVREAVAEALYRARVARLIPDTVPEWLDADAALAAVREALGVGK